MMTMIHTLFFCILTVLTLGAQAMSQSVVITQTPVDDLIKIELNDVPFAAFEENGFLHLALPEFSDPRFEGFSKNSRPSKIQGSGGFLLRLPVPEGRSPVVFGEGEKVHIEFQKSVGQTRLPDHFLTSHILSPSPDGQTALLTIPSKSLVRFYHPKEGRALWTILTTNPGVGLSSRVSKPANPIPTSTGKFPTKTGATAGIGRKTSSPPRKCCAAPPPNALHGMSSAQISNGTRA